MKNKLTKEGYKKLKDELDYLRTTKRKEVAERLKQAISYGDLSENAAYDEAKEAQSFLEGRIKELEQMINSAEIIEKKKDGKVNVGSKVFLKDEEGEKEEYEITGSAAESDPLKGKISSDSPLGKNLMGKKVSDKVAVDTPGGKINYQILKIE